jgi:hypothetical protein
MTMKNKKYTTKHFKNPTENTKEEAISIPVAHLRSLSWLSTATSITCGGVKLGFWAQTSPFVEMMRSRKCFHL